MINTLRCARCGSSRFVRFFTFKGRVRTKGNILADILFRFSSAEYEEYSAFVPVCSVCKQKFKKYKSIKIILILSSLIALFTTLVVMLFWFHIDFLDTMITLFNFTLFFLLLGIILRFSGFSPKSYMKFKTRKRTFYVKPKSAKRWIPLEDYKKNPLNYIPEPKEATDYIPEPIEATDKIIAKPKKKKKPKSKKHKLARKYYNLGKTLLKKGNLEDAINHFNISINFYPNYAKVFSEKGEALLKLGRFSEALESLNLALELKPNFAKAKENKDIVLKMDGWKSKC